jgi:NAD(P)-dependent dehydrogenase (short-subunit alcohol dehydrogenase family)
VLVTGGTSGIGRAAAVALAGLGVRVVISGRDRNRGSRVVQDIRAAGGRADFLVSDLCDEASARSLAARARDLVGQVDVLVNNAGFFPFGPTEHTTEQMLARFGTGVPIEKGELSDLGRRCQEILGAVASPILGPAER